MSLINDALRRANQTKKEQPSGPSDGAPMQAIHPIPPRSKVPIFGPLALIVLLAVVLSLASWFFWKGWQAKSNVAANGQTPVVVSDTPAPAVNVPVAPNEKTAAVTVPPVEKIPLAVKETTVAAIAESIPELATNPATTVVTSAPPAAPTQPEFKLQGIFYRIANATAIINGKTISVGEKVSGARVLRIDRQEVTVEWNGQTNVLTMR